MTNVELQALRKLLFLEASEAAEFIGNVSVRSWQHWEKGDRPVPDDVANQIWDFVNIRNDKLNQHIVESEGSIEKPQMQYHRTLDDFESATGKRNVVMWRITQSVASELYSGALVELYWLKKV